MLFRKPSEARYKSLKAQSLHFLFLKFSESSSCFSLETGFLHMVRQMAPQSAQVTKRMTLGARGTGRHSPPPSWSSPLRLQHLGTRELGGSAGRGAE